MAVKIQFRRDTAANWSSANPVLSQGELGLDLTNEKFKIGNGSDAWDALDYAFFADIASTAEAEAGSLDNVLMTPLKTKEYVDGQKGQVDGLATLNGSGLIPAGQLPSYVDDVIEGYYNAAGDNLFYEEDTYDTQITGETGKIYVDIAENVTYRWSGSAFINISSPVDIASEAEAEAGTDNTKLMTPLRTKEAINVQYSAGVIEDNNDTNTKFWTGTQSEYDNLTPDANTLYFIEE